MARAPHAGPHDAVPAGARAEARATGGRASRARRAEVNRRVGQAALAAAIRELRSQRRSGDRGSIGWNA